MPYRPLAHTADVGFEVSALTLEELYAEAVPAFTASFTEIERVEERLTREVEIQAPDREQLLVDWLGELLYAFDAERLLFRSARVRLHERPAGVALTATLRGEHHDAERHPLAVLLKGVTYHGLAIERGPAGWRGTVILDA